MRVPGSGAHRRSVASAARALVPPRPERDFKPGGASAPPTVGALFSRQVCLMYLHIKFDGHEIIVTRPGTNMMTAYRKAPDMPNLILTRSWENPTVMSPEISQFRAHAFQAAIKKARELGWIV